MTLKKSQSFENSSILILNAQRPEYMEMGFVFLELLNSPTLRSAFILLREGRVVLL